MDKFEEEEMEEMHQYYEESEEPSTISNMLGTVFTGTKESEKIQLVKLDEKDFEPMVGDQEIPYYPMEEEIEKYPELEYSSKEIHKIVKKMDKEQRREFREYETYFLTRYRQTGNMVPLHLEVRSTVREMCLSMPGQLQEAIVKAHAQLLAERKLKELCKQLGIAPPQYQPTSMVHPVDEALLEDKA